MAGFLYALNSESRMPSPETLRKWRLDYAFPTTPGRCEVNKGPWGGGGGLIIAEDARHQGKATGFYPDQQTWRKMPKLDGRPEIWVGYWNDAKPGPADLRRGDSLPGEAAIMLADGNHWLIPTLSEFSDEKKGGGPVGAICKADFDDDGNLIPGAVDESHADLWDLVHPVALGLCFDDFPMPTEQETQRAAFALVSRNYSVAMPELVLIGAVRIDETFKTIVIASCRGKWLMEAISDLKKTTSPLAENGSPSTAGVAA